MSGHVGAGQSAEREAPPLPVHGFVLAGGRSSRMGRDKALLQFCGRPMVQIAVEKLRTFCASVSIAGNRDDLAAFAPVVQETRVDVGPGAGIEAGLMAAEQPWVLFVPVDVPLVPAELLRRWAEAVLRRGPDGLAVSHLNAAGDQPTFCMMRRECAENFSAALEAGEHRLTTLFHGAEQGIGFHQAQNIEDLYGNDLPGSGLIERWFSNVNTEQDLAAAKKMQP